MNYAQILLATTLSAAAATSFAATKTTDSKTTTEEEKVVVSTQELPETQAATAPATAEQPASEAAVTLQWIYGPYSTGTLNG